MSAEKLPIKKILRSPGKGSRSPQSRKVKKSKSPEERWEARQQALANRKVIVPPKLVTDIEEHQFLIRKADFDQDKVEKMIASKDNFRDSVRMMEKMK